MTGRVAQHALHVEAEEEEHRVEAAERDELGQVGRGESLDPEDREGDERSARSVLVDDEGGEQHSCERECADRLGRTPADLGSPHEGVDQKEHPGGDEHRPRKIEAALPAPASLTAEERECAKAGQDGDRDVEVEDPAPARPFCEDTAEHDAGGARETGHSRPCTERQISVASVGERGRQDRERGRRHHRRAGSLGEPGGDEHPLRLGQATRERGEREESEPADEDAPSPDQVGSAPAEEQEAAVGEHVAADDPLQALLGEVQVVPDRGQGDVDDRDVEEVEELDEQQQREDEHAAPGLEG